MRQSRFVMAESRLRRFLRPVWQFPHRGRSTVLQLHLEADYGADTVYGKQHWNPASEAKGHPMAKGRAIAKNTICIWYDTDAEAAARFYAEIFPDSSVDAVHRAPGDYPSGKQGDVLTVEFTVSGIPCLGLNGGPAF